MSPVPDVIIAGGGIMGCLTAYHLGQHGLRCLIVERDAIGSQASGAAAGLLSPLSGTDGFPGFAQFALEAHRLHRELARQLPEETGIGYHYAPTPVLRPAFTEAEIEERQKLYAWLQSQGADPTWLEGDTLRGTSTWLAQDVQAAVYTDLEAQVEPYRLMVALAQAIERQGASIRTGEVVGLRKRGQHVDGVALADGSILEGGSVLLALGPWSKLAGEWVGLRIPVEPLRGQILKLSYPGAVPEYSISYNKGYVAPKPAGYLLAGTTEEFAGFVRQVTPEGQAAIMDNTLRVAPSLERASLLETSACLRPLSLDGLPIIGRLPGWDNLYIATGHGRKGILFSAATCKYLAQLMATGHSEWDLSLFDPQRLTS